MRIYWMTVLMIAALALATACETTTEKPQQADADREENTYTPPSNPRPVVPNSTPDQPIRRGGGSMFNGSSTPARPEPDPEPIDLGAPIEEPEPIDLGTPIEVTPAEPIDLGAPIELGEPVEVVEEDVVPEVLDFTMTMIDGTEKDLADYQGKVILIVNTASACGYTPYYQNLQALHEYFEGQGLVVLGFPSNSFNQEQGSDEDIAEFCSVNYGVTFDMFSKISVTGNDRHPLFDVLTAADAAPVGAAPVQWNFEKFLIGRDGTVVGHYGTAVDPADPTIVEAIHAELDKE